MQYWIDRGRESGVEDELLKKFEGELNRQYQGKGRHIRIHVHFIPTARDELMRALRDGGRRIQELRASAAKRGLNPNVWMNNVEVLAAQPASLPK